MSWFRIGQTSVALFLVFHGDLVYGRGAACAPLLKFSGVCTGMRLSELKAFSNIVFERDHGGRGCDYYQASIFYKGTKYPANLGFSGKSKVLSEFSVEIDPNSADRLIGAINAMYGRSISTNGGGAGEKVWRVDSVRVNVNKTQKKAWIEYVDDRYLCDSNIDY
jgi:hypothetical protein